MRHRSSLFASTNPYIRYESVYAYSILCGILSELISHINLAKPDPPEGTPLHIPTLSGKHYERLVC